MQITGAVLHGLPTASIFCSGPNKISCCVDCEWLTGRVERWVERVGLGWTVGFRNVIRSNDAVRGIEGREFLLLESMGTD